MRRRAFFSLLFAPFLRRFWPKPKPIPDDFPRLMADVINRTVLANYAHDQQNWAIGIVRKDHINGWESDAPYPQDRASLWLAEYMHTGRMTI